MAVTVETAAIPAVPRRRRRVARYLPALLIAPSVIMLLCLIGFPLVFALKNSFFFWNLQTSPVPVQYVGLANYELALTASAFGASLINTIILTITGTAVEFALGFAIALLLSTQLKGMSVSRALLIMPTTIAPIVVGFLFRYMYDPTGGLLTWLAKALFLPVPAEGLLGSPNTALLSILIADVWQWTPFFAIVLYAGLLSVPKEVIEAARLDRASFAAMVFRIKLPFVLKTALIILLLRFMQLFNTFDLVLVLTRGGPGTSSRTLGYTLYQQGLIDFNIGIASATTWMIVLIINALVGLYIFFAFRNWEW